MVFFMDFNTPLQGKQLNIKVYIKPINNRAGIGITVNSEQLTVNSDEGTRYCAKIHCSLFIVNCSLH